MTGIFGALEKKKKEKKRKIEILKKVGEMSALVSTPLYPSALIPFLLVFLISVNCIPISPVTKIKPKLPLTLSFSLIFHI